MSDKVVMETKADTEKYIDVNLKCRGSFYVSFSGKSEIARMLDVKHKEKFRVTIERIR